MTQAVSYSSCSFCGLSQKVTDGHCIGCGANVDHPIQAPEPNDQMLELAGQMKSLMAKEAKRIRSANRFTKLRVALFLVCFGWVFALWVYNVQEPSSIIYNGHVMGTSEAVDRAYLRLIEQHTYAGGDVQ